MISNRKINNILIISLFYYPDSRVGAKRFGNLVEHFSNHYTAVHVLTIPEKQIPIKDPSLSPAGVVHRVRMFPSYPMGSGNIFKKIRTRLWEKYLCLLDRYSGWFLPALIKAVKIIKTKDVDLIIATAPPFTPIFVGALASRLTGKKLILDYRDPWNTHPRKYPFPFGKVVNVLAEKFAFRNASALVFCSSIIKNDFIKKFGRKKESKSYSLTNGYMEPSKNIIPIFHNKKKRTMLYAGNFYDGRNLDTVAVVLYSMILKKLIKADNFEFIIYGTITPKDRETIQTFKLYDFISVRAAISYKDVLKCMKGADILFLPSAKEHKYAIPFKFFDYLMVNKPILAIAPKGSAIEELMQDIKCGYFCSIDSPYAIERALTEMVNNSDNVPSSSSFHYTWPNIASKYIKIIDQL